MKQKSESLKLTDIIKNKLGSKPKKKKPFFRKVTQKKVLTEAFVKQALEQGERYELVADDKALFDVFFVKRKMAGVKLPEVAEE